MLHHFLLTRFALRLWQTDKNGRPIDYRVWLAERFALFERYTLPSVLSQDDQRFTWILLVERTSDERVMTSLREKMESYKHLSPAILPIYIREGHGGSFCKIFSEVVSHCLAERHAAVGDICLTTYLDNDDTLRHDYSSVIRRVATESFQPYTFISFDYGLQYFTDIGLATRIYYPNNHFMTLMEPVKASGRVRTCYGYGSHFLLAENYGRDIVRHIDSRDTPMWIEIVHGHNVDNDVKMTLHTRIMTDSAYLSRNFGLQGITLSYRFSTVIRFVVRALQQIVRRLSDKITRR